MTIDDDEQSKRMELGVRIKLKTTFTLLNGFLNGFNVSDEQSTPANQLNIGRIAQNKQYLATIIVCLSAATAGVRLAYFGRLSYIYLTFEGNHEFNWITICLYIGAIVGSIPFGILSEFYGRKLASIVSAVLYIIGFLLVFFVQQFTMLHIAQFLIGIAISGSCVVCPVYISEFADKSIRGRLGICFYLFMVIGHSICYILAAYEFRKLVAVIGFIFPLLNLIGLVFLPESPIWLMKKHRESEAVRAINWFWGEYCNPDNVIAMIKNEFEAASIRSSGIGSLFTVKSKRNGFIVCLLLTIFQQLSGHLILESFFEMSKLLGREPGLYTIGWFYLIGPIFVVAASAVLVDKYGYRMLLCLSSLGMCVFLFLFAFFNRFAVAGEPIAALFPIGFRFAFSLGYGPIPWMIVGEKLAIDVRSIGTSFVVALNYVLAICFLYLFYNFSIFGVVLKVVWACAAIMIVANYFSCKYVTKSKNTTEI